MLAMARRFSRWAPNIAVKLPATAAGLDVLEDCAAEGITCTLTISYTVPQVIAAAERHRRGIQRARAKGITPGRCFAVIMIGRLDDYLREVAHDRGAAVSESDIRLSGLAVTKRAYSIYRQRGYEAVLLIAALRGTYHMTELAGAEVIMSIFPSVQEMLLSAELARQERIDVEVPADVIERLSQIPDFVRAYEPDGMKPTDFHHLWRHAEDALAIHRERLEADGEFPDVTVVDGKGVQGTPYRKERTDEEDWLYRSGHHGQAHGPEPAQSWI